MKQKKNQNGITLVALVITIIVLLILAGITISELSENGLFQKVKQAEKANEMSIIEEELKLLVNEWQIQKEMGAQNIEEFLNLKVGTKEIDSYEKIENEDLKIYKKEYYIIINSEGDMIQSIQKEKYKTEITYEIIETDGTINDVIITVSNKSGIQKVVCPNGEKVAGKNKQSINIDYKIENNKQYSFIVTVDGQEETFLLDINSTPITNTLVGNYPILTQDGVKLEKMMNIQSDQIESVYYSFDNGNTWIKYKEGIKINSEKNIKVKTVVEGQVSQIMNYKIENIQLANDAMGELVYDGDLSTYDTALGRKIYIDEDTRGEKIYVNIYNGKKSSADNSWASGSSVVFYDEKGQIINEATVGISKLSAFSGNINVPNNAIYCSVVGGGKYTIVYIYEIDISYIPTISKKEVIYPTLTTAGVEREYNLISIKYSDKCIEKLYKIDDGEWKVYQNEDIKVQLGETIKAKGITEDRESDIAEYIVVNDAESIEETVYDGNETTYSTGLNRYMNIKEDARGKKLYLSLYNGKKSASDSGWTAGSYLAFYDEKGEIIESATYQIARMSSYSGNIEIPNNAVKLTISGGNKHTVVYIYEIDKER